MRDLQFQLKLIRHRRADARSFRQPDGHRRIRVRRVHRARSAAAAHAVRAAGLPGRGAPSHARTSRCTSRATSTSSSTPSRTASRSASRSSTDRRACAMAFRVQDARSALRARDRAGRQAGAERSRRPDGAQHSGDRRHRRQPDLSGRPLRRAARSTTSTSCPMPRSAAGCDAAAGLTYIDHLTHNVHRGNMDKWAGFYERLFNFREIRYFDIEGKKTGLFEPRDDQPVRQDPHPDQRIAGRQVADRGIPARVPRRGHPAHRARHRRHLSHRRRAARRTASSSRTRPIRTTRASTRACPATARIVDELRKRRILIDGSPRDGRGRAAADLHAQRHRPDLLRDHPAQGQRGLRRRQLPALFESIELDQMRAACCEAVDRDDETLHLRSAGRRQRPRGRRTATCRAGTYEREISKEGFFGPAAFFYHRHPPTGWTDFEGRCGRMRSI